MLRNGLFRPSSGIRGCVQLISARTFEVACSQVLSRHTFKILFTLRANFQISRLSTEITSPTRPTLFCRRSWQFSWHSLLLHLLPQQFVLLLERNKEKNRCFLLTPPVHLPLSKLGFQLQVEPGRSTANGRLTLLPAEIVDLLWRPSICR